MSKNLTHLQKTKIVMWLKCGRRPRNLPHFIEKSSKSWTKFGKFQVLGEKWAKININIKLISGPNWYDIWYFETSL